MSARFAELDRRSTPIGEVSVRRRLEPVLQVDVYEVKLGDEFLMSSLVTAGEVALAELALARVAAARPASSLADSDWVTPRTPCSPRTRSARRS